MSKIYMATKADATAISNKVDTLLQPIGACVFALKEVTSTTVELKWQDPANLTLGGFTFAEWVSTTIVKKQGSAPTSISDGTVVVISTVRDQYKTTAYSDTQASGDDWYYRAFPTATNGKTNTDTANIFATNYTFGYYIDETDSNEATCVHYLAANTNYTAMSMDFANDTFSYGSWDDAWFLPKPCMLRADGTVDYYLDPDDYTKKEDGVTASDVSNTAYLGNAMMEFPTIYMKVAYDGALQRLYFYFSDHKFDDDYECWSCKKSDGTYASHFYLPCYEGSVISGKTRSLSTGAVPQGNNNQTNEFTYARQNGAGWNPTLWADEQLMRALFPLVFKRLNSQAALGSSYLSGASALQNKCGQLNTKGLFYGTEFDGSTTNTVGIKYFGMEQWWGSRWRRPVGIALINGVYYTKMTQSNIDGSKCGDFITTDTQTDYTNGYVSSGVSIPTNWSAAFITQFSHLAKVALTPIVATGGSSTTYACDCGYSASGVRCFASGGTCAYGVAAGVFASNLLNAPSLSYWTLGASLSYHTL